MGKKSFKDIIVTIQTEFGIVTYFNPNYSLLEDWGVVLGCDAYNYFMFIKE